MTNLRENMGSVRPEHSVISMLLKKRIINQRAHAAQIEKPLHIADVSVWKVGDVGKLVDGKLWFVLNLLLDGHDELILSTKYN